MLDKDAEGHDEEPEVVAGDEQDTSGEEAEEEPSFSPSDGDAPAMSKGKGKATARGKWMVEKLA